MEVSTFALGRGSPAPPFDLPGTDGARHSLAHAKDAKALVVAFWCNHCPYVRAWEARFVAWAKAARARGVHVVAVSANDVKQYPQDGPEAMKERAKEQGYSFPYLYDESQDVARAYGAAVTPHVFVFEGPGRRLVYQGAFDDNKDDPAAVRRAFVPDAVDAVLAGRAPAVAEAPAMGCSVKWRRP